MYTRFHDESVVWARSLLVVDNDGKHQKSAYSL